jgi:hypothetical protein|tara:strand:- start:187 stop:402 length:216 start_codon:yes stop_codon:yes gene_type:complete
MDRLIGEKMFKTMGQKRRWLKFQREIAKRKDCTLKDWDEYKEYVNEYKEYVNDPRIIKIYPMRFKEWKGIE